MSLDSLASNADIILRREADRRGFRARKLRIVEDSLSWAIIRENETLAILITNGEVFDLWIPSERHFYAFEYDGSLEVVPQLLDVLVSYSRNDFTVKVDAFGRRSILIAAQGESWRGATE